MIGVIFIKNMSLNSLEGNINQIIISGLLPSTKERCQKHPEGWALVFKGDTDHSK